MPLALRKGSNMASAALSWWRMWHPAPSHKMPEKLKGDLDGKPFEVDVVTEATEPFRPE